MGTSLCKYVIVKTSKKEAVKVYLVGNKLTIKIAADYNIAKSTLSQWVSQYMEECLYTTNTT